MVAPQGVQGIPSRFDFKEPKWLFEPEVTFDSAWRARWVAGGPLPSNAFVSPVYGVLVMDDKGYMTRKKAEGGPWWALEGAPTGTEKPLATLQRIAREQTGATVGASELMGYFVCKATQNNPDFAIGTLALRPVYLAIAKSMKDLGPASEWERRRYPMNEFAQMLRQQYVILSPSLTTAVNRYFAIQAGN